MKTKKGCCRRFATTASAFRLLAVLTMLLAGRCAVAQDHGATKDWPKAAPAAVGLDAGKLAAFDADLASGPYGLVDSLLVIRCGKQAFQRSYAHDYGKIYGDHAKTAGPLNHDVSGEYNYFSPEFHPYYRGSDLPPIWTRRSGSISTATTSRISMTASGASPCAIC
jgi:hypothetical protein